MFFNYKIIIIQEEGPPLAAMPGMTATDVIILGCILGLVAAVAIYLFILLRYRSRVLRQTAGYMDEQEQYWGISYKRLKDMEIILQQKKLEKKEKV